MLKNSVDFEIRIYLLDFGILTHHTGKQKLHYIVCVYFMIITQKLKSFKNLLPFLIKIFTCKQHSIVFLHQKRQYPLKSHAMYIYIIDYHIDNKIYFFCMYLERII